MMGGHQPAYIVLMILAILMFGGCLFFNFLSSGDLGRELGIYLNRTGDISDKYYLEITPGSWTFTIWIVIYGWQGLWLIYVLTTLCCKAENDSYLYVDPPLIPWYVFVLFMINMGFNIAWILLWDRQMLFAALGAIAMIPFTLYLMLGISLWRVVKYGPTLIKQGRHKEIWLVRILVQNAWAFYATWVTIATLLNLAIVLTYRANINFTQDKSSSIALGILALEILIYFVVENFLLDRYMRYLFSPFIVIHLALIGSITKNWDATKDNSIYTAILLALGGVLAVLKFTLMIWRHRTDPIFKEKSSN